MRDRTATLLTLVGPASAAACLLAATPAGAGDVEHHASAAARGGSEISSGGYRYVVEGTSAAENAQQGLEAVCPRDEPVVGGGAAAIAPLAARAELNTSQPYDDDADGRPDDGWQAWVDNTNSDGASAEFVVVAICDKRAAVRDYRYVVTPPLPAPEGSQAVKVVLCPKDEPVVGGGVRSSGYLNDGMHINTSKPVDDEDSGLRPDDGWRAWVDNESYGSPGQVITGFAICDKRRRPSAYAYRQSTAASGEDASASSQRACGTEHPLVGGGMSASGALADRMYATFSTPEPALNTWVAAVNNLTGGIPGQSLIAYAICRR